MVADIQFSKSGDRLKARRPGRAGFVFVRSQEDPALRQLRFYSKPYRGYVQDTTSTLTTALSELLRETARPAPLRNDSYRTVPSSQPIARVATPRPSRYEISPQ
jgi:hypothetical protein